MLLKCLIVFYIDVKIVDINYQVNLIQCRIVHKVSWILYFKCLNCFPSFAMNFLSKISISFQSHNLTSRFLIEFNLEFEEQSY